MTLKQKAIQDLHSLFMLEHSGDFEINLFLMSCLMERQGVKFRPVSDVALDFHVVDSTDMLYSFGEVINSTKYNDLPWFALACEGFIDFDVLVQKDNVAKYYPEAEAIQKAVYELGADVQRHDNVTIVSPSTKAA